MRTKQVWKYYCDFCKKAGCSKYYLAIHEKHCTLNPKRECRLCKLARNEQIEMTELLKVLPPIQNYLKRTTDKYGFKIESYNGFETVLSDGLKVLRKLTNNCPICIMAALRQAKIPIPMVIEFEYKKELEAFWKE